jgi:predicted nucleic acid-binding protein
VESLTGCYFDTSVLVPLVVREAVTDRALRFVESHPDNLVLSDFGVAEFSSAIARLVRTEKLTADEGRAALDTFDVWVAHTTDQHRVGSVDNRRRATTFLRRLDLALRTPDAIHIAIAERLGATLVTFDRRMAASAEALGIAVATP